MNDRFASPAEIMSPLSPRGLHRTLRPPRAAGPAGGATALLVHSTLDRSTSFTRIAQQLPDWTLLSYDRRGYARSAATPATENFVDQVDDLLDVVEGLGPVTGFGHSYGAAVVLAAAARSPETFRGVVAYEPPASWMPWWGSRSMRDGMEPADVAERFMRSVLGDQLWERLPSSTRAQRRAEGITMVTELAAIHHGPPYDPSTIRVPVIVARGSEATERHTRGAAHVAGDIGDVELMVVPGAGHSAHISHPADMAALIRRVAATADRHAGGAAPPP